MGSQVVRCLCFVSLLIGLSARSSAATIYAFTTFDVPGAISTESFGINDAGQIVGVFNNPPNPGMFPLAHGFLKDGASFTTIDVPGAISTEAHGINDAGQIVGNFQDATGTHAFLKDGAVFTTIDVPGAISTEAFGINAAGQIVGRFSGATGEHGFLKDGAVFTTIDVPGAFWEGGNDGVSSRQMSLFCQSAYRFVRSKFGGDHLCLHHV